MKKTIEMALELLVKNSGEGWFCILEEPKTEKFVQFAYDEGEGIFFDLPKPALTNKEFDSASEVLSGYDITLSEAQPHQHDEDCDCDDECCDDDCCCSHNESFETFNKQLGNDKNLAAEIAYAVMREVYKLKENTKINVTIMR
ncbi:MAG: hypothetical protein PHF29_04960 [Candidatus Riflebacteria bacterium]|jgi:hypothetical protein|nr:hypothetical protein [Candidatus Riflebacteria bacterium]